MNGPLIRGERPLDLKPFALALLLLSFSQLVGQLIQAAPRWSN
jgi:hypothetical protein